MKPGDFFVGVTDFFSILLPGAAITFVAVFWADRLVPESHVLGTLVHQTGAAAWAAFGVVSYVLGHVVASLGAQLDLLYDRRKGDRRNPALQILADRARDEFLQKLAAKDDKATGPSDDYPERLWPFAWVVEQFLRGPTWQTKSPMKRDDRAINAYKLARLILHLRAPSVNAEVTRYEADSKFFRSLVVVAAFALIACIGQLGYDVYRVWFDGARGTLPVWALIYLVVVFAVFRIAFTRYCELRLKSTETAFQGMLVVLELAPGTASTASTAEETADDSWTRSG